MIGDDKITEQKPSGFNPELPTGDFDDFMNEFSKPKQDMGINAEDGLQDLEPIIDDSRDQLKIQMQSGAAKASGKLCVTVLDTIVPAALGAIAKDESEQFKASPEERSELEEAFAEYMKLKGGDIPPGIMLIILCSTIYGSKLPYALQKRKIAKANEELEQREKAIRQRELDLEIATKKANEARTSEPQEKPIIMVKAKSIKGKIK